MRHRDVSGFYAVLGIAPLATAEAIRIAYRRRAMAAHPDNAQTGSIGAFIALQTAYDTLRTPAKRAAYDGVSTQRRPSGPWPILTFLPRARRRRSILPAFATAFGLTATNAAIIFAATILTS